MIMNLFKNRYKKYEMTPVAYLHACVLNGDRTGVERYSRLVSDYYFDGLHTMHALALSAFSLGQDTFKNIMESVINNVYGHTLHMYRDNIKIKGKTKIVIGNSKKSEYLP